MPSITYTMVPAKIKDFMRKIRDVGVPSKVHNQWLASVGFGSSNDRSIIRVLKMLGFIDEKCKPTDIWKEYRSNNAKQVLADAIKQGYADLYQLYPDAHSRSTSDLESFFRNHHSGGKEVITKLTATFRSLADMADFTSYGPQDDFTPDIPERGNGHEPAHSNDKPKAQPEWSFGPSPVININVQLTLPATTDEQVYANLFSAMRKHLLSRETSE